jgi:hypothetical protein
MTLIAVYLLIGCLAAHGRAADIAAEATGDPVPAAIRWVLTWPLWIGRGSA